MHSGLSCPARTLQLSQQEAWVVAQARAAGVAHLATAGARQGLRPELQEMMQSGMLTVRVERAEGLTGGGMLHKRFV